MSTDDLIERAKAFEGSDDLGNGDFSILNQLADALLAQQVVIEQNLRRGIDLDDGARDEAEGEALEQARLLGMSAERECDLLGKLDRTERKLAVARESMRNTYAMLLGEPRTAQAFMKAEDMLREALVHIGGDDAS